MAVKLYPYTTPANYTYDSDKIEVSGGLATILEDLTDVYARWHLNEATGATVLDTSGNGRDGIPINNPASVAGKLNNCLSFDGSNYVDCGDIANFERTDTFSTECWFKTNIGTTQVILSRVDYGTGNGWQIITTNNRIRVYLMNSPSNRIIVETGGIVNDNIWHHLIVTYDGSSDANGLILYLDNVVSNTIITNNLSAAISNTGTCQITGGSGVTYDYKGLADEVVIYAKELSSTEVTYRYNLGSGRENWYYYFDKPTIEPIVLFDPATVISWDSFLEILGGGNQGSIGYNLYKVDKTNKYYWNGSVWIVGGDSTHYNSASTVNTNINAFDGTPDKIGIVAYLISDGEQEVELDENQITYSINQAPIINAGSNKTCKDNETIAPFSDCSFSDPDGTIDHAYYKVDGEVDVWTEILQGGYGTLLEAVQAFNYQFINVGVKIARLQAEDNLGTKSEDSLTVTVQKYIITFNVKDTQDNHLANISFDSGEGTGWQIVNSPFNYEYDYNISGYDIILDKDGYGIQIKNIPSTDHTENFILLALTTPASIYDYFTDGSREDVFKADVSALATEANATTNKNLIITEVNANEIKIDSIITTLSTLIANIWSYVTRTLTLGTRDSEIDAIKAKTDNLPTDPASETNATTNKVAIIAEIDASEVKIDTLETLIKRIIGLSMENYRITSTTYDGDLLTEATIKIYNSKSDCDSDANSLATYKMTATFTNEKCTGYRVTKEA